MLVFAVYNLGTGGAHIDGLRLVCAVWQPPCSWPTWWFGGLGSVLIAHCAICVEAFDHALNRLKQDAAVRHRRNVNLVRVLTERLLPQAVAVHHRE